jgi:hypothetical protein
MPVRSIFRASPLFLGLALAACGTDVNQAYTAPGWYLEIPRQLFLSYPNYVAGPMSYEECETQRLKTQRPDRMLCTNRKVKPSET